MTSKDSREEALQKAREASKNIDLSQIKNITAAGGEEGLKSVIKPKKSGRFDFAEIRDVKLPSKGYLYKGFSQDTDLLNGTIKLKAMTVSEEKILSTQRYLKEGISTRIVLDRCILSSIDAKDILLYDSNYLMFYLRQISYGDDYTFEITCPDASCEKKFKHTVKISELDFEEIDEGIEEPLIIELPVSKYTVKMMLTRQSHLENISKKDRNRKKTSNTEDSRLVDTLVETTKDIIDDNGERVTTGYWEEFYESIPGRDRATITEKVSLTSGVDQIEGIACPYCNATYEGSITIDSSFFMF